MGTCRIHLTGASGAGVTTLGRALASDLAVPHHDSDDYYWYPTDPPYRRKRGIPERIRLMREMFLDRPAWILSGALDSWGSAVQGHFDLVVFVRTRTEVRLARLRDREARRLGLVGAVTLGRLTPETDTFLRWAASYDDGGLAGRSLHRHEIWLRSLDCPVLRVDGADPTADLVLAVRDFLGEEHILGPVHQPS
jgi:adenylate kinase family enzyme